MAFVSGVNKETRYVWHSVLKGYESTFETDTPLKASQLLSVFGYSVVHRNLHEAEDVEKIFLLTLFWC